MLQSSLRHVARNRRCPHAATSRPAPSTQIKASFSSRTHQRRHSSSKPPVPPNDGTRNIPSSSVKTVGTPRAKQPVGEQSPSADGRIPRKKVARQKADAKDDADSEWTKNLPSVPSTQHVDPKGMFSTPELRYGSSDRYTADMALAAFFALHRPMSIHAFLPQQSSSEAVDSMFSPRKPSGQKPGPSEVIYTLSSAVQSLEGNITQQQQNQQQITQQTPDRSDITVALTQHHNQQSNTTDQNQPQHLDGQPPQTHVRVPNGVQLMIQEVTRRFRPYNTPPVPVPMADADSEAREAEDASEEVQAQAFEKQIESQDQSSHSPHTTQIILEVHQNGDLQSRKFFTHKAPKLNLQEAYHEQSRLEGMVQRRLEELQKIEEPHAPRALGQRIRRTPAGRDRDTRRQKIYAISVKRQRRLKMKKHKYKKLMRKTRNLRRRLDKL